jgi:hypothetical protein
MKSKQMKTSRYFIRSSTKKYVIAMPKYKKKRNPKERISTKNNLSLVDLWPDERRKVRTFIPKAIRISTMNRG